MDVNTLQVSAKDSYGGDLVVNIQLKSGTVTGGQTVVYTFMAMDKLGNVAVVDTVPIKVYNGNDIILTYNKYASDLVKLSSFGEEFYATAIDSFGDSITIQIIAVDGDLTAGATESIRLVAVDAVGNVKESEIIENIKIYGLPTITYKYDGDYIDVSDNPYATFDVRDSFGEEVSFEIEVIEGEKILGQKITYKVTATDIAGNVIEEFYTLDVVGKGKVGITLDVNDGDFIENDFVLVAQNESFELDVPTRTGYKFIGWSIDDVFYTDENGNSVKTFDETFNIATLTANWSKIYTITYKLDGGSTTNVTEYTFESETIVLSNPTKDHYDFVEWQLDGKKVTEIASGSYGDKTIVALWKPTIYVITYQLNGGSTSNVTEYTIESEAIVLSNPAKSHYDFAEWQLNGKKVTEIVSGSYGDKTIVAVWTPTIYTITYDLNGGSATNVTGYTIESETIVLSNPTKYCYDFVEWRLDGKVVTEIASDSYGDKTIVAVWTPTVYTITYELDGGSTTNVTGYTIESEDIILNNPTKTGYKFLGWSGTDVNGMSTEVIIPSGSTGNREYTANWKIITYTITYELDGGSTTNVTGYTIESETIVLSNPTKDHYDFVEWQLDGKKVTEIASGSYGDKTIVAVWTPTVYTITYQLNGDDATNVGTYTIESGSIILTNPTKTGYKFLGWSGTDIDGMSTNVVIPSGSAGNREYTANWGIITYTITYELNGGSAINEKTYTIESENITLNNPTRTGYDFVEWQLDGEKITEIVQGNYGDKTIVAIWKAIFIVSNNSIIGLTEYGRTLTEIIVPTNIDGEIITTISSKVFDNTCKVETVDILGGITTIEDRAFLDCSSLKSITIPWSVSSIGGSAFNGCRGLIEINYNATNCADFGIRNTVFNDAGKNEAGITVKVGANVTRIPRLLFSSSTSSYNPKISVVIFEEGSICKTIGSGAFSDCISLTRVEIPNSIENIESAAFGYCEELSNITFKGTVAEWNNVSKGSNWSRGIQATQVVCSDGTVSI